MSDYPERIWLIPNSGDELETTWCDCPTPGIESREEDAIPYISTKFYDQLRTENARLREEIKALKGE